MVPTVREFHRYQKYKNIMDNISQSRLVGLHPVLQERAARFCDQCAARGITVRITEGYRSYAQQKERSGTLGIAARVWHSYGLAFDFTPMVDGEPLEDRLAPSWSTCIALGEALGLCSGSRWPEPDTDLPHFQLTGRFPDIPDDEVLWIMQDGGLAALWVETGLEG